MNQLIVTPTPLMRARGGRLLHYVRRSAVAACGYEPTGKTGARLGMAGWRKDLGKFTKVCAACQKARQKLFGVTDGA